VTVHKAQGSECDQVLLVLPREDSPLLIRELIYTALTRARKSVVIVGSDECLRISTTRQVERCTGLLRS
jgi:exodeoxyribonuclease V alpha subunit